MPPELMRPKAEPMMSVFDRELRQKKSQNFIIS